MAKVERTQNNLKKMGECIMPTFKTIRQTATLGMLPEYRLRLMVAQGICPGIRVGSRFMINVEALAEQLDRESRENVKPSDVESRR